MFRFACPKFFTFSWITTLVIYTYKYLMTFCQLLIDIRKSFWFSWTRQHLTVYRPLATVEKITRLLRNMWDSTSVVPILPSSSNSVSENCWFYIVWNIIALWCPPGLCAMFPSTPRKIVLQCSQKLSCAYKISSSGVLQTAW